MDSHVTIRNKKGFSIIELAYVVLVFGIIMLVAIPSFRSLRNTSRLTGAANELMGDIHYTRSLAVSKRRTHHIDFEPTRYRIIETATNRVIRTRDLPAGYTWVASTDPSFYAWGLADATNITINGQGTTARNLALSANGNVSHF